MARRWVRLLAAAGLVVAAGLLASWAARGREGAPDAAAVTVTGTIEALQVDVSARIAGRIVTLAVREGQPVERGQMLARLDDAELAAETRRAEAAVRTAEAQLRDLRAGARAQEIEEAEARASSARAQLEDLEAGARVQEIEQARAALRNAAATREWTERELQRARMLFARELIAASEADRARRAHEVAVAEETSARERLALVEAGPRRHEVEAARAGPRPEAVSAAEAQVAQARAALALARTRAEDMLIRAPVSGLVLHKHLEAGEMASPGVPILTLVDPEDVWLRAFVPETEVGRLRIGQPAAITVDAYPGRRFEGVVSEIASEAEFTPRNVQTRKERVNLVFRIKIAAKNPDGVLKPGLPADAEIHP